MAINYFINILNTNYVSGITSDTGCSKMNTVFTLAKPRENQMSMQIADTGIFIVSYFIFTLYFTITLYVWGSFRKFIGKWNLEDYVNFPLACWSLLIFWWEKIEVACVFVSSACHNKISTSGVSNKYFIFSEFWRFRIWSQSLSRFRFLMRVLFLVHR